MNKQSNWIESIFMYITCLVCVVSLVCRRKCNEIIDNKFEVSRIVVRSSQTIHTACKAKRNDKEKQMHADKWHRAICTTAQMLFNLMRILRRRFIVRIKRFFFLLLIPHSKHITVHICIVVNPFQFEINFILFRLLFFFFCCCCPFSQNIFVWLFFFFFFIVSMT